MYFAGEDFLQTGPPFGSSAQRVKNATPHPPGGSMPSPFRGLFDMARGLPLCQAGHIARAMPGYIAHLSPLARHLLGQGHWRTRVHVKLTRMARTLLGDGLGIKSDTVSDLIQGARLAGCINLALVRGRMYHASQTLEAPSRITAIRRTKAPHWTEV